MDRRTFLNWCGVGTLASSMPWAIAACTPQASTPPTTTTRSDGFTAVGTLAQLDQSGQILAKEGLPLPALIVRDPADAQKLIAVNPTCTHNGCLVDWKADAKHFACACHGSQFSPDGSVLQGPAASPLMPQNIKVEGDQILVKTS